MIKHLIISWLFRHLHGLHDPPPTLSRQMTRSIDYVTATTFYPPHVAHVAPIHLIPSSFVSIRALHSPTLRMNVDLELLSPPDLLRIPQQCESISFSLSRRAELCWPIVPFLPFGLGNSSVEKCETSVLLSSLDSCLSLLFTLLVAQLGVHWTRSCDRPWMISLAPSILSPAIIRWGWLWSDA